MIIPSKIDDNAIEYSNDIAIIEIKYNKSLSVERRCLTWHELAQTTNRIANMLKSSGISKGSKVALLLRNCLEWLPIYFGVMKTGAIVVPLNYNNSVDEISYCIDFAGCSTIFFDSNQKLKLETSMGVSLPQCYCVDGNWNSTINLFSSEELKIDISEEDPAAIYFSSGTTGKSKAILLSHSALFSNALTELNHHSQTHEDKFLCTGPLFHTGAKIHWFGSLLVGGSIVLIDTCSAINIASAIQTEKIKIVWLPVPLIQDILSFLDIGIIADQQFSSLKLMHSGAQFVPEKLILTWLNRFPHTMYDTSYGLTEATGPGCIDLGVNNLHKLGSIGKIDKCWCAKIVDPNGNNLGTNAIGELLIKGPGVMMEYYKDAKSTAECFTDEWLHTGDLAYMDEEGFFYIAGRKKDMIISGGENIYPVQLENLLRKISCVRDAAVFGCPNERMGEIVAAVIELKDGCVCTKSEFYDYCKDIPQYQLPVKIFFGKVIRNSTGKIDRGIMKSTYLGSDRV